MRTLESAPPIVNIFDLFAVVPDIIDLGRLLIIPTMFPDSQSKTRSSFLPAPPAKSKS
jgi:hypothetical protein